MRSSCSKAMESLSTDTKNGTTRTIRLIRDQNRGLAGKYITEAVLLENLWYFSSSPYCKTNTGTVLLRYFFEVATAARHRI